jgi:hypothetical protein
LGDPGIVGRIITNWIIKIWLGIGINGRLF